MVAHQTSVAEVSGSNLASTTMILIRGIYHNDPDSLQDHCDNVENHRVERETYP